MRFWTFNGCGKFFKIKNDNVIIFGDVIKFNEPFHYQIFFKGFEVARLSYSKNQFRPGTGTPDRDWRKWVK